MRTGCQRKNSFASCIEINQQSSDECHYFPVLSGTFHSSLFRGLQYYAKHFALMMENRSRLEANLETYMALRNFSSLLELYKNFADKQNIFRTDKDDFLVRYGRLCSINYMDGSSSWYNWIHYGINRFYFQFDHNRYNVPLSDNLTDAILSFNPAKDYAAFN